MAESWIDSVAKLVAGITGARRESSLLDLLADASDEQLEELSRDRRMTHDLITSIDDHPLRGANRRRLLAWAATRLPDLTPSAQVSWLLTFTRLGRAGREAIVHLILSAIGNDLRALMAAIDAEGDHRDLAWIVFNRLGPLQQRSVLSHIKAQSVAWTPAIRVISDLDDTLIAWQNDPGYPRGALYPGVIAFLARCGQAGVAREPITILTARPEGRGLLEDRLRRALAARGVPTATVLSGNLTKILGHETMVAGKAINLQYLVALHPKDRFVLVGDSGQGDVALARQAIDTYPSRVVAAFIHKVTPSQISLRCDTSGILFFDNYVEAAVQACQLGLLSEADVAAVVAEARVELTTIVFRNPAQEVAAQTALEDAISAAGYS